MRWLGQNIDIYRGFEPLQTKWGQNETYVVVGYFSNLSLSIEMTAWCDAHSGIGLGTIWETRTQEYVSREEMTLIETGVRIEVTSGQETYQTPIDTNSTIMGVIYYSDTTELEITIEGSTGTSGVLNITLPKGIVPGDSDLKVYMDGEIAEHQLVEDSDNYYVYVEYQHSTHTLTIVFSSTTQFWAEWPFLLVIGMGLMVLAVVIILRARKPKSEPILGN